MQQLIYFYTCAGVIFPWR